MPDSMDGLLNLVDDLSSKGRILRYGVPMIICWAIWMEHNAHIFDGDAVNAL